MLVIMLVIIEFIKNNIQTLIQLLGLISLILLAYQIYSTNKWNKKTQSLKQLKHSFVINSRNKLKEAGFDINQPTITESDLSKLLGENNYHLLAVAEKLLNKIEYFSIAYNMNMYDKQYIFHAYSEDIISVYNYFEPLIKRYCIQDGTYYSEFKKCYKSIKKIENFEMYKLNLKNFFFNRKDTL